MDKKQPLMRKGKNQRKENNINAKDGNTTHKHRMLPPKHTNEGFSVYLSSNRLTRM